MLDKELFLTKKRESFYKQEYIYHTYIETTPVMPNPFIRNDGAAVYLDYYASGAMEKQMVNRLYTTSTAQRRVRLQAAEAKYYPSIHSATRSEDELKDFANRAVNEEMRKREIRRIELEQKSYPSCRRVLGVKQQKEHIQSVYSDPFKKIQELEKKRSERADRKFEVPHELKERERAWVPVAVAASSTEHDGRRHLVSSEPLLPSVRLIKESNSPSSSPDDTSKREYWTRLSRPLQWCPKYKSKDTAGNFCVYTKFRATSTAK